MNATSNQRWMPLAMPSPFQSFLKNGFLDPSVSYETGFAASDVKHACALIMHPGLHQSGHLRRRESLHSRESLDIAPRERELLVQLTTTLLSRLLEPSTMTTHLSILQYQAETTMTMVTPLMTKVRTVLEENTDSEVDEKLSFEMTTISNELGVADAISLPIDLQPTQLTAKLDSLDKICRTTNAGRRRNKK
jgi:hypothetical protein